ncbi:MAG: hypothetical protein H9855_12820 [Candidatus Acinetobacter avistercoris]|nr:hypothetical protein [Candidatus Acinetobacter avistercoris]
MNKRIPCEADLQSSIDTTWANAVMACETGNPYCGADGRCYADGACFEVKELTLEQALVEIEHLKSELNKTRVKCNQIEASHLNLIASLEREKDFALKQGKSERMFALRRCLVVLKRGAND